MKIDKKQIQNTNKKQNIDIYIIYARCTVILSEKETVLDLKESSLMYFFLTLPINPIFMLNQIDILHNT